MQYTIYDIQYTIYSMQYTIYDVQYTIYNMQYTIHNTQYTIYNIPYTIYNMWNLRSPRQFFTTFVHLRPPKKFLLQPPDGDKGPDTRGTRPDRLGEPTGRCWGTARPPQPNAFLYRESKNPFRQAWLGKYMYTRKYEPSKGPKILLI